MRYMKEIINTHFADYNYTDFKGQSCTYYIDEEIFNIEIM